MRKKRIGCYSLEFPLHIIHDQIFQTRLPQLLKARFHLGEAVTTQFLDQRVSQHQGRVIDKRPGNGYPLLFTA